MLWINICKKKFAGFWDKKQSVRFFGGDSDLEIIVSLYLTLRYVILPVCVILRMLIIM